VSEHIANDNCAVPPMAAEGERIERCRRFLEAAAEAAVDWYDLRGDWRAPSLPALTRERCWLSFALYAAGRAAFADAVVRKGETAAFATNRFNIFDTNIAAALLASHGGAMAADVRCKLEGLVRDGFAFKPGNRQPDYQFHGYNDNMPAKATLGLILGGEMLGESAAVDYGLWNLRQLRAMLVRQGINSEYNSPTYTPLTLHAMGEIAAHAQSAEARELALGIEHRLWLDIAARFHPETGVVAGPYSRAYTVDTVAHVSLLASLLWFVLGDAARPSPLELFEPPDGLVLHHLNDRPFNIAQMCWLAAGTDHVPDLACELFASRRHPRRAVATSEQGDAGTDFPARRCRIETFLESDFTVGTASTPFCGGEQTLCYFATYRRTQAVASFRDVGTVFAKFVVDDDLPGTRRTAEKDGVRYTNCGETDNVASRANTITLQDGSTAMVLTHPHLALGGDGGGRNNGVGSPPTPVRRLSELVVFPSHFGGADEIMVGGRAVPTWAGTAGPGEWIACRRGRLLIGIRPLAYTCQTGPAAVTLETNGNYELIRFTYHAGAERVFARDELRLVFGGFVAEHASVDEYPSLAAFAAELERCRFTDYYWLTRRVRYRRPASSQRSALELETSWSPGAVAPRFAAVNGRGVEWPVAALDGVVPAELPFLAEPFAALPSFFPWRDFKIEWCDIPYAINDREDS